MAATSAGLMSVMAITSAVAGTAGAIVNGIQNYSANQYAEAEAKINAQQARENQRRTYQEESLNATQKYRAARHDLATGANLMASMGNIGTSAESAYREGAFNLAEDLSALKWKYDVQAANYGTQANMYGQQAKMARENRRRGLLASALNVATTAAGGAYNYMDMMGYRLPVKTGGKPIVARAGTKPAVKSYAKGGLYYA